jgi:DinB superfamily
MRRPAPTEFAPYYARYIDLVPEVDPLAALETQLGETLAVLRPAPEAQGSVRHPPYTWTVKEVVGHITDTERIFGYRALRFARGDVTPLPGFDEETYTPAGEFDRVPLAGLVGEFETVRRSHLALLRHLPAGAWDRSGEANGVPVTVRALAFIMAGHARHHTAILRKRLGGKDLS